MVCGFLRSAQKNRTHRMGTTMLPFVLSRGALWAKGRQKAPQTRATAYVVPLLRSIPMPTTVETIPQLGRFGNVVPEGYMYAQKLVTPGQDLSLPSAYLKWY